MEDERTDAGLSSRFLRISTRTGHMSACCNTAVTMMDGVVLERSAAYGPTVLDVTRARCRCGTMRSCTVLVLRSTTVPIPRTVAPPDFHAMNQAASVDPAHPIEPAGRRYTYTAANLFTAIVEHPGWNQPKVLDLLALDAQDVVTTVQGIYGEAAQAALINPAVVLMQAVIDMPRRPIASLFWTASRQGTAQWTEASSREAAAKAHHQQTGQAANLVLPGSDLVNEALRLNGLLERNDARLVVSPRLMMTNEEA